MVEITWHAHAVTREHRESLARHRGCVVWFTGLSGSGKSTVANEVDRQLNQLSLRSYLLDGDNVRHGLNASVPILEKQHGPEFAARFGLGFGPQDRQENIRRIAAVAQLFASAGIITLTAFVSPYRQDRNAARQLVCEAGREDDFVEVFVDTPLEICEQRDPKGLYKKARTGEIADFTGISAPYESPEKPELRLDGSRPIAELAGEVIDFLRTSGKIPNALSAE